MYTLVRELLSKPDGFLTAMYNGKELLIENYQRKATCANLDDLAINWVLKLRDCGEGNIKR